MRIIMISPTVGEAFGQERIVSQSAEGLRKLGHEVFLIAERQVGSHSATWGSFLIPSLFSLPHLFTPLRLRKVLNALKTYLATVNPDVIHLMDQPHHKIIDFLKENYPTVLTAHTVAPTCPASNRLLFTTRNRLAYSGADQLTLGNQLCKQASGWSCLKTSRKALCLGFLKNDLHRWHAVLAFQLKHRATKELPRIIAISAYVRQALVQDGFDKERVKLIYNPVESLRHITPFDINTVPRPLIVSACRLVPLKGIHIAIQALEKLKTSAWTYWICGTGPEEIALKRLVKELKLEARVFFRGLTGRTETLRIIKSAQIFLQPNVGPEGFGLSVAEALSLGTPTIASQLPAFDELIVNGQTGILTEPSDFHALSIGIQKLLSYPEMGESLGSQASIVTPKYFSLDAFLKNTVALYKEIQKPLETPQGIEPHIDASDVNDAYEGPTEIKDWNPEVINETR